jgi:hypothetical protein
MNLVEFEHYSPYQVNLPLYIEVHDLTPDVIRRISKQIINGHTSIALSIYPSGYGKLFTDIRAELLNDVCHDLSLDINDSMFDHFFHVCTTANRKLMANFYDCVILYEDELHPKYSKFKTVLERITSHSGLDKPIIIVQVKRPNNTVPALLEPY